jgi:hypothetical protein
VGYRVFRSLDGELQTRNTWPTNIFMHPTEKRVYFLKLVNDNSLVSCLSLGVGGGGGVVLNAHFLASLLCPLARKKKKPPVWRVFEMMIMLVGII